MQKRIALVSAGLSASLLNAVISFSLIDGGNSTKDLVGSCSWLRSFVYQENKSCDFQKSQVLKRWSTVDIF